VHRVAAIAATEEMTQDSPLENVHKPGRSKDWTQQGIGGE